MQEYSVVKAVSDSCVLRYPVYGFKDGDVFVSYDKHRGILKIQATSFDSCDRFIEDNKELVVSNFDILKRIFAYKEQAIVTMDVENWEIIDGIMNVYISYELSSFKRVPRKEEDDK